MRFIASFAAVGLLVSSVVASADHRMATVHKTKRSTGPTDVEILNFALTLEYLERDFYAEGVAKFSKADFVAAGYPAYSYDRILEIASHEKAHVAFLAGALGSAGVGECKYNFGITDVPTFLAIARVLESVGVTAYLGAAPDITAKAYLSAAGSILTVEARHASFLNTITGISGFPAPYDPSLTYSEVYSLAAGFIVPGSCGSSGTLPPGIHAYPTLVIKTAAPKAGKLMGMHFGIPKGYKGPYYAAFINGAGNVYVKVDMSSGVVRVPTGLSGITFVIISKNEATLADANTIAGPAVIYL